MFAGVALVRAAFVTLIGAEAVVADFGISGGPYAILFDLLLLIKVSIILPRFIVGNSADSIESIALCFEETHLKIIVFSNSLSCSISPPQQAHFML